ncbi:MAG: hypothetical protein ABSA81_10085 [Candidatus Bathyarchaeia archaeon]
MDVWEAIQGRRSMSEDTVMESEEKFAVFLENLVMDLVPLMQDRK